MPSGAFTISVDYLHGTVDGCVRVVAIPHITAYRIPRDFADNLLDEQELKQAGIYLLVNEEKKTLYVGQAYLRDNGKGVLARMVEPHRSKKEDVDNWTTGYALTCGTPHLFGATELNYLERFFYDQALENKQYQLLNGSRPHASDVSFSTKTILRNYVDYAFFLLQHQLGCEIYVKKVTSTKRRAKTDSVLKGSSSISSSVSSSSTELYIPGYGPIPADTPSFTMNSRGTDLVGYLLDEKKGGFLVLAGGKVSEDCTDSFMKRSDYQKRLAYEQDGSIQNGVVAKPIVFPSVSAAASILGGASLNGKTAWNEVK